ncbi:MAG: HAMP domain-containing protein [Eubacterium sp.]|nr:HAMP domain-containing protein [Eubacterium sp.]
MKRKQEKDKQENYRQENYRQNKIISIRTKLLGIILPAVIIIVTVLVGISYKISRTTMENTAQNLLQTSVENQSSEIEAWLNANLSALGAVKQSIETMDMTGVQLQQLLNGYYGYNNNFPQGLYIADASGTMMTADSSTKTESDPTNTVWYQEGMKRVNMGFTSAYTNADGEAVISASGILNDGSGSLKVISADLSLQKIGIIVSSLVSMEQAQAFLVDSKDLSILAHRDSSLVSAKLDESQDVFLKDVSERLKEDELSTAQIDGNMAAFAEIVGTDWILVSYIPVKVIYRDVDRIRTAMILTGILSVLLLGILIERVVYVVIRPVRGLTKAIMAMTEGDFTVRIETHSRDEIGVMGRCMEKYAHTMRSMIASIHDVSGRLHVQAGNSNDVSGQMYDASKMQSASMQELNETVEQLSISVNEIAQNATTLAMVVADTRENSVQVNDRMRETVEVSQKGKADMQNVGSAMQDINESVIRLQEAIGKVGKASEEITNITNVIGNIADETNLLSLNASIEAARAGEAGRGFAVVATQIGQLAQTSADSVHHIEKLISEINGLVRDAVSQADDSVGSINHSSGLVNGALHTFDQIFDNIDMVSTLVQQMIGQVEQVDGVASNVAAISQEQAASSQEILASSDTMVEQANHITDNSKSVASGAKELTDSAVELAHQIEIFKIGEDIS